MINLLLLGVVLLAVGGCACVLWAERGGPRWVCRVATVTLAASELVRRAEKRRRRRERRSMTGNTSGHD
ncbi:hypothetical protein GCM10012285_05680 [Streptomyces kronopolitis]|uniref:Uncharacterized protein n=1 Tax=Streptomyces kronopolitis TaxID=1612435 RepID=A0ABQ2J0S6_9ACTN|nr:hypothetical protein [Streptomyces kronopolitis]GGN33962.1 hypothetical protein GCM10012285_05680 [Streptomyces kronopolitis]